MRNALRVFLARIRGPIDRRKSEAEFDEESAGHIEMLTVRFARQGMNEAEARQAARRQFGGVTQLKEALRDMPKRTGLMTLGLMCMSLVVQQQTGGDLVRVLERLSRTVRDRLLFMGRLRAATAASRATAILMIVLPPAVLAFFVYRKRTYLDELLSSSWGRNSTILAICLEIAGALWVMRILKDSEQS